MDSGNDFSRDEIVAYLQERNDQRTLDRINEFKEKDSSYQSLFELLDYTKQELNLSDDLFDQEYTQLGISEKDDFLMRLFSGNLQPDDNYLFLNELNHSSSKLYDDLVGDLKSSTILPRIPFWERVPWLAGVFGQPNVPSKDKVLETITSEQRHLSQTSEDTEEQGLVRIPSFSNFRFKPAVGLSYAFVILLVCGAGIWGGFRYYNTGYKINRAVDLISDNYNAYYRAPRLSGGFAPSMIGQLMAPEDSMRAVNLAKANTLVEQAIDYGSKSFKAKLLKIHLLIIGENYEEAERFLNQLDPKEKKSAQVLNTRGALKFSQEEWQEAVERFQLAIHSAPNFKEAYYNLALAQEKLQKKEEAVAKLNAYLELENDEAWKDIALALLKKFKAND